MKLIEEVKNIAENAGDVIMEIYNKSEDFKTELKKDQSPLTIADQKANDLICNALMELDPKLPIISEENKQINYEQRSKYQRFWMVDPLDGTKEFIKRNGEFTVNIALIENGKPILGVVYAPVLDVLYFGEEGKGSYKLEGQFETELKTSIFSTKDKGLRVVCSRSHLDDATQNYLDQLIQPEILNVGSSLKFLMLAEGKADLYPRLAPTMEWDTAAAHCILNEAGGKILEFGKETAIKYNKQDLRNPNFTAFGTLK